MRESDVNDFIAAHAGITFKSCVQRTESEEITILANKRGEIREFRKQIAGRREELAVSGEQSAVNGENSPHSVIPNSFRKLSSQKSKKYLLGEGIPVPFLVHLGVMTAEGKVVKAKYDKFRQINRFLEMLDDILDDVCCLRERERNPVSEESPLSIVDFGSGKSYLTFAVQHYLTEIKRIPAQIFGLDLKKDVISYCSELAQKLGLKNLSFAVGDIASFGEEKKPDIIITLHACDTATDYALDYAIRRNAKAILSVPCCQHEINAQLNPKSVSADSPFAPLLKYGLIKERFSALVTDAIRAEILEKKGYRVQILEFIEESATPKNILIRAVQKKEENIPFHSNLLSELRISQKLDDLQNFHDDFA